MSVCRVPGCPRRQHAKLCADHAKQAEAARGSRQARGYDAAHDKERARINRTGIESYRCARCGESFDKGDPFQLGHTDDRRAWSGPEHIRCNTSAAGIASHAFFERTEPAAEGWGAPPNPPGTSVPPGRALRGSTGS